MTDKAESAMSLDGRNLERLTRLETIMQTVSNDISEMKELIARMVRVEERQSNNDQAMHRMGRRLDEIEDSIKEIERRLSRNSWTVGAIERVWWIVVTAIIGMVAYAVKSGRI